MGAYDIPWLGQGALVVVGLVTAVTAALLYSTTSQPAADQGSKTQHGDHLVLTKNSHTRSYKTVFATYGSLRTFYRPHTHHENLDPIADLPLLVFIHGLGGSLDQFGPLLGSLVNVAPCFGIELPGHGASEFDPQDYEAYTTSAIKVLWRTAILEACAQHGHRRVVLVGHSYGCSIAALLATDPRFTVDVAGIIALCPKAAPPSYGDTIKYKAFLSLPDSWLNVFRWWDKRGDVDSNSVMRFVGEGAGIDLRTLQLRYNAAFQTSVWKRTAFGALPEYDAMGRAIGGVPGKDTWARLRVPLFMIAGEADKVTKPSELAEIVSFLKEPAKSIPGHPGSEPIPVANSNQASPPNSAAITSSDTAGILPDITTTKTASSTVLKTATLPAPAAHALLYDHRTYRTVAGLIEDFLAAHVSAHLSLGWQLQQLTTTFKWDVKNLEKWSSTLSVSGPIANNLLRALKTLREQDPIHNPATFTANWSDTIYAVIDISHDTPVYRSRTLEEGGIQYHKFPTVSKIPPNPPETTAFIALVDRLRAEMAEKDALAASSNPQSSQAGPAASTPTTKNADKAIAVHCHYGYNRTGFLICAYLVERVKGYGVQRALDAFRVAKPPGIRHEHFVDALWVRYAVGLKRAPTMKLHHSEQDGDGKRKSRGSGGGDGEAVER